MPGFGSFPFGSAPWGFDPSVAGTGPTPAAPFDAPYIDLAARDVPLDDEGNYLGAHRVDHDVQMIVGHALGAVPVLKSLGTTLNQVQPDTDAIMSRDALRRVQIALQAPIDAGDVRLESVTASSPVQGRVRVHIRYTNLRLPDPDSQGAGTARDLHLE